ncbi:MAG: serine protease Do, partial [Planctomycetota bacterium]
PVVPSGSPRAGSGVMFGIRPVYTDDLGGVLAESVTKNSPADQAGLQAGDRILSWNGEEIDGARALGGLLGSAKPGEVIEVTIERDGKEMMKKVTLRARGNGS